MSNSTFDFDLLAKLGLGSIFIPIKGNKQPLESGWQKSGYNLDELSQKFKNNPSFKAVGILTGNGLLSIDVDGLAAYAKAQELSDLDNPFPPTVMFTSRLRLEGDDKPSKFQALYRVPEGWDVKNKPINCKSETGTEQLDFRYNGRQSVISGQHPKTRDYRFVEGFSPDLVAIAMCPVWVKDYFDSLNVQPERITRNRETVNYSGLTSSVTPPLEYFLARANQEALNGLPQGSRFYGLQALAADLIGCEDWLNSNGVNYSGDAEQLFLEACQNSGCNDSKTFKIFPAFLKKSPSPAIGHDGMEKRLHWYRLNNDPEYKAKSREEYNARLKLQSHINSDSDSDRQYQDYLAKEAQEELIEQAIEEERLTAKGLTFIDVLRGKALRLAKKLNLSKRCFKGFGATEKDLTSSPVPDLPTKIIYNPDAPFPTPADYEGRPAPFFLVDHTKYSVELFLYAAIKAGWKDINDQSPTGSGKSHSVGQMLPDSNNSGKHWYIDVNHNNPSTAFIEDNYKNLPARQDGMTIGKDGKLKRSYSSDDKIVVPSNCHLADVFNQLSDKNIDYQIKEENAPNPICNSCSFSHLCANSEGDGYGYRKQRREALERPAIRADIRSLPGADDFNYSKDLIFCEEGTEALDLTKQVAASLKDFDGMFGHLEGKLPEVHEHLKPLRLALRPYLSGEKETGKYGLDTQAILGLLSKAPGTLLEDIQQLEQLIQDLTFEKRPSIALAKEDTKLKYSNPQAYEERKRLNQRAREHANAEYFKAFLDKLENLYSNFLVPLLKVWGGDKGAVRIAWKELKVTYANERTIGILKAAKARVYLDATPDLTQIAQALEIEPSSILRFSRDVETPKNLTVSPVHVSGIGSRDWSDAAKERVKAISTELNNLHPDLVELGYKKHSQELDLDGWWGNHNRGTNEFKGKAAIALYGLPTPNVGQVQDEYLALHGNLDGFVEYYESLIQTSIIQALGRQRAALEPEQQYTLYLVAQLEKFDLSFLTAAGYQVEGIKEGLEITPKRATKSRLKNT